MRKNHILFGLVLLYSYLFYGQASGVNFPIFTIALITITLYKDNTIWQSKSWFFTALGSLISAIFIVFHHHSLALVCYFVSILAMLGFSNMPRLSLPIAILNTFYSLFTAHVMTLYKKIGDSSVENSNTNNNASFSLKKIGQIIIPISVTLLFGGIYADANPAFGRVVNSLFSIQWISGEWLLFSLGGFGLLFPFFYPQAILDLSNEDLTNSDQLIRHRKHHPFKQFKLLDLKSEYQMGWYMLAMLNVLILIVNFLDIYYLGIVKELPEGISFKDYVHQGVYALILSIILAIGIILYFFRNNLNFYRNPLLRNLAYVWIAQNLLMVLTSAIKTGMYVEISGLLTYKRIGVFTYLTLTTIGLITTFTKIYKLKSNWFLFRKNAWAFYTVLLIATCINWDRLITQYNMQHLDKVGYAIFLSDTNLPELVEFAKHIDDNHISSYYIADEKTIRQFNTKEYVERKKKNFLERYQKLSDKWQSWNYDDERVYQFILKSSKK
jgi:hypothetical protein